MFYKTREAAEKQQPPKFAIFSSSQPASVYANE